MNASREYLELVVSLQPDAHADCGTAHGYLLQHGQEWGPHIARPEDVKPGEMKGCFVNAYQLAIRNPRRFFYVEGYAMAVIPTEHAWCVDRAGNVIDNTPGTGRMAGIISA